LRGPGEGRTHFSAAALAEPWVPAAAGTLKILV